MQSSSNAFSALEEEGLLEDLQDLLLNSDSGKQGKPSVSTRADEASASCTERRGEDLQDTDSGSQPAAEYKLKNPLVWMDLEMTGLDPETDHIMEIAVLITDGDLTLPYLEGPEIVIHLPDRILDNMSQWCTEHHEKSGLTQKCRDSQVSLQEAEDKVLEFMQRHTQSMEVAGGAEFKGHLAGNSIYVDRAFLQRYMPRVHKHLHWRHIDVSTILELARRWYPKEFGASPRKRLLHTAMADVRESLRELTYYRRNIFKQQNMKFGMQPQMPGGEAARRMASSYSGRRGRR